MNEWNCRPSGIRTKARVLRLRLGEKVAIRIVGEFLYRWLHWVEPVRPGDFARTFPHSATGCKWCGHGGLVEKGYAPGDAYIRLKHEEKPAWNPMIIEIPAELEIPEFQAGQVLELECKGTIKSKRLSLTLTSHKGNVPPPEKFDVRPILERLWGESYVGLRRDSA